MPKITQSINWTVPVSVLAATGIGLGIYLWRKVATRDSAPEAQPGKVNGQLAPQLFKRSPEWHRTTAQYLYDVMNEKLAMNGWNDQALKLIYQCGQEDFKAVFNAFGIRSKTLFGLPIWEGNLAYWLRKILADPEFYQSDRSKTYELLRKQFASTKLL